MLTVTKSVDVQAEVEVEFTIAEIVEAIQEEDEELAVIGKLVDSLGAHDTLMVMQFCIDRVHRQIY